MILRQTVMVLVTSIINRNISALAKKRSQPWRISNCGIAYNKVCLFWIKGLCFIKCGHFLSLGISCGTRDLQVCLLEEDKLCTCSSAKWMLVFSGKKIDKHIYHQSMRLEMQRCSLLGIGSPIWCYLRNWNLGYVWEKENMVISVDSWEGLKPISAFD